MSATGPETDAWVGLGSNLGDPAAQLRSALIRLGRLPQTRLVARSHLYRNPPMGPQDQPDFVNAVARLATRLDPLRLLHELQRIERQAGRVRGRRWGERVLDLDLLLWGDRALNTPELVLPHPGMPERAFVLYPLAELAPGLRVPGYGALGDLLRRVSDSELVRLDDD
jgi:2-amino-4-hydroxy-6-hydroxymethyldihydropteridine diphosphokinase